MTDVVEFLETHEKAKIEQNGTMYKFLKMTDLI